jgi:hypothetical protein
MDEVAPLAQAWLGNTLGIYVVPKLGADHGDRQSAVDFCAAEHRRDRR